MGFTPRQVDDMSLWEMAACVEGYTKANGGEVKPAAPSVEEHLALVEKVRARRNASTRPTIVNL
ncbi:hypothetical protein J5J86_13960 [Aquabacter sp. L1I39]|uniref:hypothetical protein n=1 Tax=Aquabacter sp. L1I39 TaxID=2820278 RepID=UPI001ADCF749|nr:hypothetical protein [Aquabacter sp. L1I39]QTL01911.1 hypothetical protein J5J86_13960 [Aquabacter sp. L1I39]